MKFSVYRNITDKNLSLHIRQFQLVKYVPINTISYPEDLDFQNLITLHILIFNMKVTANFGHLLAVHLPFTSEAESKLCRFTEKKNQ